MVKAIDLIGSNSQLQNHWVRRIIAAIIDGVIAFIILIIFWSIGIFIPAFWLVGPFIPGLVWLLYSAILEGFTGATLGKRFFNLQVVSVEGRIDIIKAFIRNASKIHILFFLVDWIAGFITDGDPRQRFLDRIADTTVVRTDMQEIFLGAYQPPAGPMPAPYQEPAQAPQYPAQIYSAPQQTAAPPQQKVVTPAPVAEEKVEPAAEGAKKDFTREELVNLRKDELTKIAREKDLKTTGTKRDLIDRILGEEVED